METRGMINYDAKYAICDQQWHQNGPTSSSFSIEEADEEARFSNIEEVKLGQISSSEDVVLNTLEEGQSSGTKRKIAFGKKMQDDGIKEDLDIGDQNKQQTRTRSVELRNQNERIRRQKQKEKMKILQELIPNCNKRDRSSTLDDAIKYIKSLQHQLQMTSIGAGHSTFHSPMMMMQQARQQGVQMQTCPPRGSNTGGMEYENEMGILGVFTPFNPPTNPYSLPSSATSRLPLESPSNIESSCMDRTPFYHTTSSRPESTTSQPISEQSFTWRESTARVLPSKVVQSHLTKEIMDCGSSNSTSNEWPRRSTARKLEEHKFQMNKFKFEGPF